MRVTKIVREYIEKQVNKIFPNAKELPEVIAYNETIDKGNKLLTELTNRFVKLLADEKVKFNAEMPDGFRLMELALDPTLERAWSSPLGEAKDKAEEKLRKDKEEAVSNIIVALELGGTKDTLEKMLAELAAKVKGA